jgi:hypothetical protein
MIMVEYIQTNIFGVSLIINSRYPMSKDSDEKKCAFGVFLDIVDSWQEMNKKGISQKNPTEDVNKECPFCCKEIESREKICRHCGRPRPE